jgi:hypothetical protein
MDLSSGIAFPFSFFLFLLGFGGFIFFTTFFVLDGSCIFKELEVFFNKRRKKKEQEYAEMNKNSEEINLQADKLIREILEEWEIDDE